MNDEMQALCFFAGANSIFYGEKLLTTDNPEAARDRQLFARLGIEPQAHQIDPQQEPDLNWPQVAAAQPATELFYDAAALH